MARFFDPASLEYLGSPSVSYGGVLTFACWFRDNAGTGLALVSREESIGADFLGARYDSGGIQVYCYGGGGGVGSTNYSLNVWNHAACVIPATSGGNAICWLNGGNKATFSSSNGTTSQVYRIGVRTNAGSMGRYMSGDICEVGIWHVALSDDDVAALAKGISPWLVKPESLYDYWPLIGRISPEPGYKGNSMTLNATPDASDHYPQMIYPRRRGQIVMPASVAASDAPFFSGGGECVGLPIWEACGLI